MKTRAKASILEGTEQETPQGSERRRSWFAAGAPLWALAGLAAGTLAGILVLAALADRPTVHGYAEFSANHARCAIISGRSLNVRGCKNVSANVYEVTFSRDLGSSVPVASRGTCCPGTIAVSRASSRSIIVALSGHITYPVLANVVVP